MKRSLLTFRLDDDLSDALAQLSVMYGVSRSDLVRRACRSQYGVETSHQLLAKALAAPAPISQASEIRTRGNGAVHG